MNANTLAYYLLEPSQLIPTEEVDGSRVSELVSEILKTGRWIYPITAHRDALFVMDGHHRLMAAKRLRLKLLPVVLLDYDSVEVVAWREGEMITPQSIFAMAHSRQKFPCKTTRHIFKSTIPGCDIPLSDLRDPNPVQNPESPVTWATPSMSPL